MRTSRFIGMMGSVAALTVLSGCVTHEVRVNVPAEAANGKLDTSVEGRTVIGETSFTSPPGPPLSTVRSGPLPKDVTVTAWRRDQEGLISRGGAEILTALPWWQRFPIDMATDIAPTNLVVRSEYTLVTAPVAKHTRAQLDAEAAAAGYASVTPHPQSNP